jgi:hypothetical protein
MEKCEERAARFDGLGNDGVFERFEGRVGFVDWSHG